LEKCPNFEKYANVLNIFYFNNKKEGEKEKNRRKIENETEKWQLGQGNMACAMLGTLVPGSWCLCTRL
jgi:hypothetical protein